MATPLGVLVRDYASLCLDMLPRNEGCASGVVLHDGELTMELPMCSRNGRRYVCAALVRCGRAANAGWRTQAAIALRKVWPNRSTAQVLPLPPKRTQVSFVYRRVRGDGSDGDDAWTVGRVRLWPNGLFLTERFVNGSGPKAFDSGGDLASMLPLLGGGHREPRDEWDRRILHDRALQKASGLRDFPFYNSRSSPPSTAPAWRPAWNSCSVPTSASLPTPRPLACRRRRRG